MSVFYTRRGTPPTLGKPASDYAVGDVVKIPVNGTNIDFIVVNQGIPSSSSLYDSSCNGTWLLMKDCYELRQWHSSNDSDYANSTIKSYLDSTFFNLLSTSAKSAVKQVKIPYRPGSGESKTCNTGANGLSCKIFLLSMTEVGFSESYQPTSEGAKLSYFESGTGTSANNKRIAYLNGSATGWWLRSPYCDYSSSACRVLSVGNPDDYNCSLSYGVRPALVLPNDTKFDPDTNVIL